MLSVVGCFNVNIFCSMCPHFVLSGFLCFLLALSLSCRLLSFFGSLMPKDKTVQQQSSLLATLMHSDFDLSQSRK